jgi:ABC-type uncharacterized transport system permease subunit
MVGTAWAATACESSAIGLIVAVFLGAIAGATTTLFYFLNPRPAFKMVAGVFVVFAFYSLNWRILDHRTYLGFSQSQTAMNWLAQWQADKGISDWRPLTILVGLLICAAVMLPVAYLLKGHLGLILRSVGTRPRIASPNAFYCGLYLLLGLMTCNAIVALGAWYQASVNSSSDIRVFGTIIHALASAIIGELLLSSFSYFRHRRVSVPFICLAPVIGSFVYQTARAAILWQLRNVSQDGTTVTVNQQDTNTLVAAGLLVLLLVVRLVSERKRGPAVPEDSDAEGAI